MTNPRKKHLEIEFESELFALINTIINLHQKYREGSINDNFFRKAIKNSTNNLIKLNIKLKEKQISLSEVIHGMNLIKKYNKAIGILRLALNSSDDFLGNNSQTKSQNSNKVRSSILELPGLFSKITSSFITLMDALKLEGLKSSDLIIKLLKELKYNINKIPITGFEEIQLKIEKISYIVLDNSQNLVENKLIVNKLYEIFKEFQQKLN